ncbi:MAG: DNA-processing protein DprA [Fimbriimonas sp.]
MALTSHLVPNPAPISPQLWRSLREVPESELSTWVARSLSESEASKVTARLECLDDVEEELESLADRGIFVVTEFDQRFPQRWKERLRGKHPALLFVAGAAELLNQDHVGIVGSREVDEEGSSFARAVAAEAVSLGKGVVSGGARGVDQIAMAGAFEAGGASVGILADSLVKTIKQPATAQALESGQVCLATPFSPNVPFSVGAAMGRNKLIYAMSVATVVVAASEGSGGTWAGAIEALDQQLCPVLVRDIPLEGNRKLIGRGGHPIADVSELSELLESTTVRQQSLF